jgi:S-(hydroxymethyl)glutathione dehydrogenase/alcohol dehydrogenase
MAELPSIWRAAVLRRPGSDLEILEVRRPPLQTGQVLVRLNYSGVCRSQLMEVRGLRGEDPWLPHLLGHEGVGVVADVGPDVTKVKAGDRVVVGWMVGNGIDSTPPVFVSSSGEPINAGRVTTFSEYTVVSENRVYHAPKEISDRDAVLFGCSLLTGAGMVLNETRLQAGQQVLINGAGGVGLAALLAATGLGVEVVVADPDPVKRSTALAFGATRVFDPSQPDDVQSFRVEYPSGVDVALDASGSVKAIEFAFSTLRYDGGILIFASHPPTGQLLRLDPHDLIRGRQIRGSWGGASHPDADIPALAQMIHKRDIDLSFLTPRTYDLGEVNQALADLADQRAMRPLLRMYPGG